MPSSARFRQYGQASSCESCVGTANNEQVVRDDICREQYADNTPEQFFCLTASAGQRHREVMECYAQADCCDLLREPDSNPCGRCVDSANANVSQCYDYCEVTTEPGSQEKVNCYKFCNAAYYSTKLTCEELGLCVDEYCEPPKSYRR
jgi:hypothetical protein